VGAIVALTFPVAAEPLGLPVWLAAAVGLATGAWGVFVHRRSRTERWVGALTAVAGANFVIGLGLAVFALTPGGARLRLFGGGVLSLAFLWYAAGQAIIRWNVTAEP
jgi:hypothetical protein